MQWTTKIIFAAAVASAMALPLPHARAEAPTTGPAVATSTNEVELTDAERAKLEAASETGPTSQPSSMAPSAAAATRPAAAASPEPSPRRSYSRPSETSGGGNGSSGGTQSLVLPSSYWTLTSRSIFIKGSQDVIDHYGSSNSYANNSRNDRPISPWPTTQSTLARPETNLIFDGASRADGRFTALIEDATTHNITHVSPGDRLARGQITALALDTLDYTANGRVVHVGIGQNLDGVDAALGGSMPSMGSGGGGDNSGSTSSAPPSNAAPTAAGAASSAAANDVLEKLRKRRQQELTGK